MFLHTKLENKKHPIKICFIGCGKFVSMFLAQYNHLDKIQIDTIVDINIDQAKKNCLKSGLNEETVTYSKSCCPDGNRRRRTRDRCNILKV